MNTYAFSELAQQLWVTEDYPQLIQTFETKIQANPKDLINYWFLGLAYLLQGEEETAQLVWLGIIAEQSSVESDASLESLVKTLTEGATQLTTLNKNKEAWVVRHYIHEFSPQSLENIIALVDLSITLDHFSEADLATLGLIELLETEDTEVESTHLSKVFTKVLQYPSQNTLNFAEACFRHLEPEKKWAERLIESAKYFAFERKLVQFAIALTELCLKYRPNHMGALGYLPRFYTDCNQYTEAVETALHLCKISTSPESRFSAHCILLQTVSRQGDWTQIPVVAEQIKEMMSNFFQTGATNLSLTTISYLIVSANKFFYLSDDIQANRQLQNQAANLFLKNIETNAPDAIQPISINPKKSRKRLRIGYIASTLRNHSVGWLSRWLFKHHDTDAFEVTAYLVQQRPNHPFFETWFAHHTSQYKHLSDDIGEAVKTIREDDLDILVDLDSGTLDQTCTILALKPAPIQVTWLGFDASGLPSIDYFIADPYVLPADAQDHYHEKIWRLPETYIAVDGFESGIPTLRRSELNIPDDAVIFWSSQASLKRNPGTVQLQMQILRAVPNSYFLVKGIGDTDLLRSFFKQIAQEEGVSMEQLRFLPNVADEYTHRANLHIADIVLDTFPYNGATTTLETLWMEIPLVTLVGQQFSARNSYAFMKNIGVSEGIAHTEQEYVDWGIRLGQNEQLRNEVMWKLRKAKKTSPLWNAQKFTREMENAYQQMYTKHIEDFRV